MARSPKVTEAAAHIDAVELSDGTWAYYDEETELWYVVTTDDLEFLYACMHDEDSQVSADPFSHFAAATKGTAMPEGWEPSIPEQRATRY